MVDRKTFVVLGRLSFPSIFTPRINTNEDTGTTSQAYEAQLIVQKDEPSLSPLAEHCAALLKDKHGAKIPGNVKRGIREGSEKPDLAGMSDDVVFFTAKSKHKPPVVGPKKIGITDPDEVYGGAWVRLAVTPYYFDKGLNKGVSFSLEAVQKVGDAEHFGSVADPDALFAEEDFIPGPTAGASGGW